MEESVGNLFHSHTPCTQVPPIRYFSPQKFAQKYDQGFDLGYYQSKKRKRTKVYHALPMSYGELLPVLVQNYGISVIPARPRRPPYPKGYDINARCEYHRGVRGIPQKIARPSRTRSNPWSTQIRSNSENWSVVIRSIKMKDQLGVVFVCLLIMNVFICKYAYWKCKLYFDVSICMKWIDFLGAFCHHEFCRCI